MDQSERNGETIENRTYDEIQVGDKAVLTRTLRLEDIQLFATVSGDVNPAHLDPEYASSSLFHEVIAHGLWGGPDGTLYLAEGNPSRVTRLVPVG